MSKTKRIFIIGDFKDDSSKSISLERRHWIKGFIRAGHDVQRFSYQNILRQYSPWGSKLFTDTLAHSKTEKLLLHQIRDYCPDIVMVLIMKDIRADIIERIRQIVPHAHLIGRDVDWFPQNNRERTKIAKKMDSIIATNAGPWLQYYKDLGVRRCAFIPCPCDPDIQRPYPFQPEYQKDIIFLGKIIHGKYLQSADPDRATLLTRLQTMQNVSMYGANGKDQLFGIRAFCALSNAKIALSINAVNTIRLCHSDRFINSIACGTLVLSKRVPDTDLLFEDKKHVCYFDAPDEFFELTDWYLKHDSERKRIASAGMERAHKEFNCTRIAQLTMDLIERGTYSADWRYIL
jgi:spore maturation protein CgeB